MVLYLVFNGTEIIGFLFLICQNREYIIFILLRFHKKTNMDKRKKIVLLIFSVFMFFPMYCCAAEQTENANEVDWNPVINAIIHVESKGNSRAKSGSSVGVLQITPVLVAECNQILKKRKSKSALSYPIVSVLRSRKRCFCWFNHIIIRWMILKPRLEHGMVAFILALKRRNDILKR